MIIKNRCVVKEIALYQIASIQGSDSTLESPNGPNCMSAKAFKQLKITRPPSIIDPADEVSCLQSIRE